jgi:hypothetical protein
MMIHSFIRRILQGGFLGTLPERIVLSLMWMGAALVIRLVLVLVALLEVVMEVG